MAPVVSSATRFLATGFPPIESVRPRGKFSDTCRRPICPATSTISGTAALPTWPYYDIYTPIAKVDHNLTTAQRLSVMYQAQIRHRVIWSNGMGPYPEWGEPQVNPIDNTFDQIANSWKVRVNHDYVINSNLINHITFSVDRYINRGANKTAGQGWNDTLGISGIPDDDGAFPAINYSGGSARLPPISGARTTKTGRTSAGASPRA